MTTPDTVAPIRQAVILAGGRGTRLGAMTDDTPKPLLPVAGAPFLAHVIRVLWAQGIADIVLSAGYLGRQVEAFAQAMTTRDRPVRCRIEPGPLGTGGAVVFVSALLDDRFFVLNGDTFFDLPLGDLDALVRTAPAGERTAMALRHVPDVTRYGAVDLDGDTVSRFREKASASGDRPDDDGQDPGAHRVGEAAPSPRAGLINAGVYAMERRVLDRLPAGPCSLERDLLPLLAQEGRLRGRAYQGYFVDIGIPADLRRAQTDLQARREGRALPRDPAEVEGDSQP